MAISVAGTTLHVFGGLHMIGVDGDTTRPRDKDPYRLCDDAYAYDVERSTWSRLPDPPFACYGWQACTLDDRHVILAAGVLNSVDGQAAATAGDGVAAPRRPNDRVLVYDVVTRTYRELPTRLPLPAATADPGLEDRYPDPDRRARAAKYVAAVRNASNALDLRRGGFRMSPGLSLIGGTLYMTGGECLTPHANASDDVLIGRIALDGAR